MSNCDTCGTQYDPHCQQTACPHEPFRMKTSVGYPRCEYALCVENKERDHPYYCREHAAAWEAKALEAS